MTTELLEPAAARYRGMLLSPHEVGVLLDQPVGDVLCAAAVGRLPVVWVGAKPYIDRNSLLAQLRLRRGHVR